MRCKQHGHDENCLQSECKSFRSLSSTESFIPKPSIRSWITPSLNTTKVGRTEILYRAPSFGNLSVSTEKTFTPSPMFEDIRESSFFINRQGPHRSVEKETTTKELPKLSNISSKFLNLMAALRDVGDVDSTVTAAPHSRGRKCPSRPRMTAAVWQFEGNFRFMDNASASTTPLAGPLLLLLSKNTLNVSSLNARRLIFQWCVAVFSEEIEVTESRCRNPLLSSVTQR